MTFQVLKSVFCSWHCTTDLN